MHRVYQCVEVVGQYLVGASAHELHTFSLNSGSQISSWACSGKVDKTALTGLSEPVDNKGECQASTSPSVEVEESDSHPSAKRRKLSDSRSEGLSPGHKTTEGEKMTESSQITSCNASVSPGIVTLTPSKDGKYVIIVTGEDKTIRVLRHDDGKLEQISERSMPKRPCAVTLSSSGSVIICADKFGDVYSLPLLIDLSLEKNTRGKPSVDDEHAPEKPKQFVSSANDLTVHSARNRKALQNQLKQNLAKADKVEANIGQQLLLGHVSMLTDIALVEECGRGYIITADRDEHIRVSRGIPQSHIIETYCLGHREFVSRLCLPDVARRLLISGGGDDDLFIWDWLLGDLLQKVNISSHIEEFALHEPLSERQVVGIGASEDFHPSKVVVSGIKHLIQGPPGSSGSIVVMCEGVSALLFFALSPMGLLSHYQTLHLRGNPLAMAVDMLNNSLIVSVDLFHLPGSAAQPRVEEIPDAESLQALKFENMKWTASTSLQFREFGITGDYLETLQASGDSWTTLYNLGNLRKRAGGE